MPSLMTIIHSIPLTSCTYLCPLLLPVISLAASAYHCNLPDQERPLLSTYVKLRLQTSSHNLHFFRARW